MFILDNVRAALLSRAQIQSEARTQKGKSEKGRRIIFLFRSIIFTLSSIFLSLSQLLTHPTNNDDRGYECAFVKVSELNREES
jgi:hypothetical protein